MSNNYVPPPGAPGLQPGYMAPPPPPSTGLATSSLVLGIVSLLCCGPVTAIPGLILGAVAISKANKGESGGKGMAIGGLVLSIIAILATLVVLFMYFVLGIAILDQLQYERYYNNY